MEYVVIALALLVVLIVGAVAYVVPKRRRREPPSVTGGTGTDLLERPPAAPPVLEEPPVIEEPVVVEPEPEPAPVLEKPEPTAGRLVRLRARLSRSQNVFGRGLLTLLSRDKLDDDTWDEVEESLILADVGVEATRQLVDRLRERARVLGTGSTEDLRKLLAEELTTALEPGLDRTLSATAADRPAVLLVVGVNGSGKTTTCGKIGRVLVADGRTVLLGAADTFRAAAADQLATWAGRVGAEVVRGPEGGDPAAVAFDAVKRGIETGVDTVVIDTAGRLQNKVGLMDELGKVKRVVERHGPVDETLLVLDATTGQNGLEQARVFTEVVNVTGVVLTKLDGTAKGGIVIAVQRKLGIPVKLVGLGEGPDDLAPFEPAQFVDALLATDA
jgi:fused signal recognition particle receptor